MKKLQVIALLVALVVISAACSSIQPSIVGEWYAEKENITMLVNKDGTFSLSDKSLQDHDLLDGKYRIEGDKFFFTPTGETELSNTFVLKGDKLTLTYENYTTEFVRVKK